MSAERGDGIGRGSFLLETLRARIANGVYPVGSSLPAQRVLAEEFDVSRDTVQRVLRELKSEGWVDSRQGSGTRVIEPPIHSTTRPQAAPRLRAALGTFIARAFAQRTVRLDVFTLTSESLDAHIRLQAERIRTKEISSPERIELRMLLPAESAESPYPRAKRPVEGGGDTTDVDRRLQERLHGITRRHTSSLRAALKDLETEGLVPSVTVEVRKIPLVPPFKLYLLRDTEALFGPYKVVERSILLDDDTDIDAVDVLGLGSTLTRHVNDEGDPNSTGSVFIESWQDAFDSWWNLLAPTS
ncbi:MULTISPECIES: GntR family transcriptional regulator [Streptomyces]|uniref:GntR family transcriptional regulator n=1 Tax=Streptomyces cyaneochromogenes TaxID=2496836 RepID=A0A3S9M9A8_9ACTN|nr:MULTISPECIES: GntR family transcriptional regulator [Streptomyces]AZQ35695.1 GntR family transcriptional regulator [Streptomyces cyaneochromogenes]MCL8014982.1 GntR family transcriptional regulator [Streptomyces sp. AS02]